MALFNEARLDAALEVIGRDPEEPVAEVLAKILGAGRGWDENEVRKLAVSAVRDCLRDLDARIDRLEGAATQAQLRGFNP